MRLLPPNSPAGWTAYIWLVYLPLWVAAPLRDASPAVKGLTGVAVLAFLGLYFRVHWLEGRDKLRAIAAMVALGCVCLPWNPGTGVFFVYAATFVGSAVEPPRAAYGYLAGLLAVIAVAAAVAGAGVNYGAAAFIFSAMLGAVMIHFSQERRLYQRLAKAREEVEHLAKEAERERIARDLHDVLGHTLSVIVLKSELASRMADTDMGRAVAEIRDVERISREALAEVRAAVLGYRASGMADELARARRTLETAGVELESAVTPVRLLHAEETVLALALREAVTNVIRHAGAKHCRVRFEETDAACELEVSDDGNGACAPEGGGLGGMRRRVEEMGGQMQVKWEQGAAVLIRLPRGGQA